jgi:hypothetical protein
MKRLMVAVALGVGACSGSNTSSTSADVQSLTSVAQDMSAAVASYRSSAAAMSDASTCQAAQSSYDAQMGPMVDRMKQLCGGLDDHMKSSGHPGDADLACASNAMGAEVVRHKAAACAAAVDVDKVEATRHADAMDDLIAHQSGRATELGSAMGMSGMMDGGMMGADGGWTLPDGGTMGACYGSSDGGYMMDGGMH